MDPAASEELLAGRLTRPILSASGFGAVSGFEVFSGGEEDAETPERSDAEREAIREARRVSGRTDLSGSVLYSTSRPCAACEHAAAEARVSRMYVGAAMVDAGVPRP